MSIKTADADAARIAELIRKNIDKIDSIVVSMDSHQRIHIAHPLYWEDAHNPGRHPDPFTVIKAEQVPGTWKTTVKEDEGWSKEYLLQLDAKNDNGKEKAVHLEHTIWPEQTEQNREKKLKGYRSGLVTIVLLEARDGVWYPT